MAHRACVDCNHHRGGYEDPPHNRCHRFPPDGHDPVTGQAWWKPRNDDCKHERSRVLGCGPSGRFFEPKEQPK
jgi:hypothetical protein